MASPFSSHVQSLLSWAFATTIVCGCAIAFFLFHRGDEELRRQVEIKLAKSLPDQNISIGSASLIPGEGIRLRKVSIVQPANREFPLRMELAFCEEVVLDCVPTIEQLVQGRIDIRRVHLRGLSLRPIRYPDGTWNLQSLCGSSHLPTLPPIILEDARIEFVDQQFAEPILTTFQNIHATIAPDESKPNLVAIWGTFTHDQFRSAEIVKGLFDPITHDWSASGKVLGLQCDVNLWRVLTAALQTTSGRLNGLRATADLAFSISKSPNAVPSFQVAGSVSNGRFDAPELLSKPITDISAREFEVVNTNQEVGWRIEHVKASYDAATLDMSMRGPTLALDGAIQVDGSVGNLHLSHEFVRLLPEYLHEKWTKYQPLGRIDVERFQSRRMNGRWQNDADVTCRDISLLCAYFKYPVVRSTGVVKFRQDRKLTVDLWGAPDTNSAERPIHITANIDRPGPDFSGKILVQSQQWLPLDERIRNALKPGARQILLDMDARGEIQFASEVSRDAMTQGKIAKNIFVKVRKGAVQYDGFPYPLRDIQGDIHVQDHQWEFQGFEGQNDSCIVNANGTWIPSQRDGQSPGELDLEFIATDIPCDAELRNALPAGPQQIWRSLRPTGHVDHAKIDLFHRQGMTKPRLDIVVTQLKREDDPLRRSLEIQPSWFPLRMNHVTGIVDYKGEDGSFSLRGIHAEYGSQQQPVKLHTEGEGNFREDGSWNVHLNKIRADNVETTREFSNALPIELADAMRWLQFHGKLWLDGEMHFAGTSDVNSPVDAGWYSTINIDNGSFTIASKQVQSVFGQVTVVGSKRNNVTTNSGTAEFDSLICQGVQIRQVHAPWAMDKTRLVFGTGASNNPRQRPKHLTAQVFGGGLMADGAIGFDGNFPFQISIPRADFNAATVARDFAWATNISGRGEARLELSGSAEGMHTLVGQGNIRLRDANLAKLPAIIALVNKMRMRNTRPDVFSAGDIDFTIQGPYLNLPRFDLRGESLSMKGRGWVALDRRVNLEFYTLLGDQWILPWMRPAIAETSQRLLQIRATGTTDNLQLEREVLPGLNDLFQEQASQSALQR